VTKTNLANLQMAEKRHTIPRHLVLLGEISKNVRYQAKIFSSTSLKICPKTLFPKIESTQG